MSCVEPPDCAVTAAGMGEASGLEAGRFRPLRLAADDAFRLGDGLHVASSFRLVAVNADRDPIARIVAAAKGEGDNVVNVPCACQGRFAGATSPGPCLGHLPALGGRKALARRFLGPDLADGFPQAGKGGAFLGGGHA